MKFLNKYAPKSELSIPVAGVVDIIQAGCAARCSSIEYAGLKITFASPEKANLETSYHYSPVTESSQSLPSNNTEDFAKSFADVLAESQLALSDPEEYERRQTGETLNE